VKISDITVKTFRTTADRFDVALALNPGRPGAGIRRPGEPLEKNIQVPQTAYAGVLYVVGFLNISERASATAATARTSGTSPTNTNRPLRLMHSTVSAVSAAALPHLCTDRRSR